MYSVSPPPPQKKNSGCVPDLHGERESCLTCTFDIHNKKVLKLNNSQDSRERTFLSLRQRCCFIVQNTSSFNACTELINVSSLPRMLSGLLRRRNLSPLLHKNENNLSDRFILFCPI